MIRIFRQPGRHRAADRNRWRRPGGARSGAPWLAAVALATLGMVSNLAPAGAEEPARKFLDALREAKYYDTASEYLKSLEGNPLVPVDFREVLVYEQGATAVLEASTERNLEIREQKLNAAQALFEQFLAQQPGHYRVSSAKRQVGNVLVQRARIKIERTKREPLNSLLGEARAHYDEAFQLLTSSQAELRDKLEGMKAIPDSETELIQRRDVLREEYLESQLLSAAILEEKADTAAEGSEERTKLLTDAAAAYGDIYEKYRKRLAGLYARLYQARCLKKMGQFDQAISYLVSDLLAQPDVPDPFREMKTRALQLAMECWMDPAQKKYAEAISRGSAWIATERPNETQDPEWVQLRLTLARAYQAHAQKLEAENPRDKQIKESLNEARKIALALSRLPGAWQDDARKILADLPGGLEQAQTDEVPQTFGDARKAGMEAIGSMESAKIVLTEYPERIGEETDPDAKSELQKTYDEAGAILAERRGAAIDAFTLALDLADSEIPLEDINSVRYYLAYLLFESEAYYDAYVVGRFLATRYPDSGAAKSSAKVAMAAALRLYSAAPGDEKPFESELVTEIAGYMARTWAGEPEAVEAVATLIPFELKQGNLAEAESLLETVPLESPARFDAELRVGQAYWSQTLKAMRELKAAEEAAREESPDGLAGNAPQTQELQQSIKSLGDKSRQLLEHGVQVIKTQADYDQVRAPGMLSLVQIHMEGDESQKALELLSDEQRGLLKLVESGAFSQVGNFAEEVYRQTLRAYIDLLPKTTDVGESKVLVEKAKQVMTRLRQHVGDAPDSARRLIGIYYGLARDLEQEIRSTNNPEEKKLLADGFQTFLAEVGREATEVNVMSWVAESFYGLAEGFDTERTLTSESRQYYGQAAETYKRILDKASEQEGWLSNDLRLQVQLRRAMALREMEEFEEAIRVFRDVLLVKNTMLNVQVEAAKTYQDWAAASGKSELYDKAIKGGYPAADKRNTIWGWIKLSTITSRYPDFRDTFHEARYNLALCHYRYGKTMKDAGKRRQYLDYAKRDITQTQQLFPEMGGNQWKRRYDTLMRSIQKELGETQTGLPTVSASNTSR